mmetsp:Transcript_15254/g.57975  ORF Transcript_15254/g.57975 Transcript_15254/m.57975 type:complete len:450 (+) Transcript_15254:2225-3574(+)
MRVERGVPDLHPHMQGVPEVFHAKLEQLEEGRLLCARKARHDGPSDACDLQVHGVPGQLPSLADDVPCDTSQHLQSHLGDKQGVLRRIRVVLQNCPRENLRIATVVLDKLPSPLPHFLQNKSEPLPYDDLRPGCVPQTILPLTLTCRGAAGLIDPDGSARELVPLGRRLLFRRCLHFRRSGSSLPVLFERWRKLVLAGQDGSEEVCRLHVGGHRLRTSAGDRLLLGGRFRGPTDLPHEHVAHLIHEAVIEGLLDHGAVPVAVIRPPRRVRPGHAIVVVPGRKLGEGRHAVQQDIRSHHVAEALEHWCVKMQLQLATDARERLAHSRDREVLLLAFAHEVHEDGQGRIELPPDLRRLQGVAEGAQDLHNLVIGGIPVQALAFLIQRRNISAAKVKHNVDGDCFFFDCDGNIAAEPLELLVGVILHPELVLKNPSCDVPGFEARLDLPRHA